MADSSGSQHGTRRGAVRRWIARGVVFLLLGAAVNVAVAWGVTYFGPFLDGELLFCATDENAIARLHQECLAIRNQVSNVENATRDPRFQGESGCISLFGLRLLLDLYAEGRCWETRAGFPSFALTALHLESTDTKYQSRFTHVSAISFKSPTGSKAQNELAFLIEERGLPLQPIWPGFAINTMFYAVILWLLFAAPFKLRRWRRVRKGLCVKCAYPVGSSDVCTECGHQVR